MIIDEGDVELTPYTTRTIAYARPRVIESVYLDAQFAIDGDGDYLHPASPSRDWK